MEIITTREQFRALAKRLGVRHDWHEPDEQSLTARVEGRTFDNAGFWPEWSGGGAELHVIFSLLPDEVGHDCPDCTCSAPAEDVAAVNLATLCAWASES